MNARYLAPSVRFVASRPQYLRLILALFALAVLCLLLAWAWQPQAGMGQMVLAGLAACAAVACVWHSLRCWPTGSLAWDGGEWRWFAGADPSALEKGVMEEGQRVQLSVGWDGGHWLWLRLEMVAEPVLPPFSMLWWLRSLPGRGPPIWVWLDQRNGPEQWGDLRRAVHFPAALQTL